MYVLQNCSVELWGVGMRQTAHWVTFVVDLELPEDWVDSGIEMMWDAGVLNVMELVVAIKPHVFWLFV